VHLPIVPIEGLAPGPVADLCQLFARANDVGEQYCRQQPVAGGHVPTVAGGEFLNFLDQRLEISDRWNMAAGRQFDVPCVGQIVAENRPLATGTALASRRCVTSTGTRT